MTFRLNFPSGNRKEAVLYLMKEPLENKDVPCWFHHHSKPKFQVDVKSALCENEAILEQVSKPFDSGVVSSRDAS